MARARAVVALGAAACAPGCSNWPYTIGFNITGNEHLDGALVILGIAIFAVIILWQVIRR